MDAPVTCLRITPRSRAWPASLREIEAPPDELWLRGRVDLLARSPALAIVGSRSPTAYGEAQALRFARAFADAGATVVSGLARGVDQAAHAATLEVGGATLAVLGSGVDCPWPAGPLADDLARRGLLLSEFPPGLGPRRHHFPLRNRILAGLCVAVVVIEAGARSGSLITARWAVDQGRELFALPGRVDHPMARGCHRLLREGAHLAESPEEVLDHLGLAPRSGAEHDPTGEPVGASGAPPPHPGGGGRTARHSADRFPGGSGASRGGDARAGGRDGARPASAVERALVGETLSADQIAGALGCPVEEVLSELVQLELCGRAIRGPGGLYRRA